MRRAIRYLHHKIYEYPRGSRRPTDLKDVQFLRIGFDNVAEVLAFRESAQVALFRTFLARGSIGVYAIMDGRVIGHAWGSSGDGSSVVNGYFKLSAGETLIHYCSVDHEYRGRRIYQAMITRLAFDSLQRGDSRVLIDTSADNLAAIRGIEQAGFLYLTDAWYILARRHVLIRWQRTW